MKILLLSVLLLLAALIASLFGQGGGILYTPIQVLLGIPFKTAATTSLFLIMVMAFSSTIVFHSVQAVDWQMAIAMETPTMVGAFLGGFISDYFSNTLLILILVGLLVVASFLMNKPPKENIKKIKSPKKFWDWQRNRNSETYNINILLLIPITLLIGFLTSLVGIGGGAIKVPMMVLLFGVPINIAIGSSAFMVGLTASAGMIGHITMGHWDWRISLILAIPVFIGGQMGSKLSTHIKQDKLRKWFSLFLIIIAALILIQQIGI
ncbi:hypothetical protein BMS3Abin03_03245 [bacterium BMS3Abin03]|nr:hypothetical protein BMS3Abin03_03245 [bacterium BMS3Abin03]